MNSDLARQMLAGLLAGNAEAECVEVKEAKTSFDSKELGEYFSALSNEANLKGLQCGWLVFGVSDRDRKIVGTTYRRDRAKLDRLKYEIASGTNSRITFVDIHEITNPEGRVLLFQIPAAPRGIPTSWKGHYYGREGESLGALSLQELEQIRNQAKSDWSSGVCADATLEHLDQGAVDKAKLEYKRKHPQRADDVDRWDDMVFLNKAKVAIEGKLTRAAILLLGNEESEHFLLPSAAKITWILKDRSGVVKDYEHFCPPFIVNVDRVFAKIRNLKYRYIPDESLFPMEVDQYDPWVIREVLHNCIAHQDYELRGRISVMEKAGELVFNNLGSFIPGSVEAVIRLDSPPQVYRNRFLADAMVNLNMIDTIGSGIKKMFERQRERFFPLPDYDLCDPARVIVTIPGRVINENYTRLLVKKRDIDLPTVMLLDKVQKGVRLSKEEHRFLKAGGFVEGRYPNLFVAAPLATTTHERAKYIRYRGFDDRHYKDMIVDLIKEFGAATRTDIDNLLMDKLSEALDMKQKRNKIANLLYAMSRRDLTIVNEGTNRKPRWVLRQPS